MKIIFLLLCMNSISLFSQYKKVLHDAELRTGPDAFATEILTIGGGETVLVLNDKIFPSGYLNVSYRGKEGYVNSMYLSSENVNSVENNASSLIPFVKANRPIPLKKLPSGVFDITVRLNGVLTIDLILDTGASELSLSPDVVLTLIRTKTINQDDWLEGSYYQFADGTTAKSDRFRLRQIEIGSVLLLNVAARISDSVEAPLLLGQNVLRQLKHIEIDYSNNQLIIKE